MPTIIPNVTRSRRIWMNSFSTIAQSRRSEKWVMGIAQAACLHSEWLRLAAGESAASGRSRDAGWRPALPGPGSCEVVLCRFHQADEHVLEAGADFFPFVAVVAHGGD